MHPQVGVATTVYNSVLRCVGWKYSVLHVYVYMCVGNVYHLQKTRIFPLRYRSQFRRKTMDVFIRLCMHNNKLHNCASFQNVTMKIPISRLYTNSNNLYIILLDFTLDEKFNLFTLFTHISCVTDHLIQSLVIIHSKNCLASILRCEIIRFSQCRVAYSCCSNE